MYIDVIRSAAQGRSLLGVCREGRVLRQDGEALEHALYVVGWAKRGPTGIIGKLGYDFLMQNMHRSFVW